MTMLLKCHQTIKSIFVLLLLASLTACGGTDSFEVGSDEYVVTTLAGATTAGSTDGTSTAARFRRHTPLPAMVPICL